MLGIAHRTAPGGATHALVSLNSAPCSGAAQGPWDLGLTGASWTRVVRISKEGFSHGARAYF